MAEPRKTGGASTSNRTARGRAYERPIATVRTDRSGKNDTEAGLTPAQRRAVNAEESRVKGRKTEAAAIINSRGEVVRRLTQGKAHNVSFAGVPNSEIQDSVIIHNHPGSSQRRAFGNNLATRVGSPLSAQDLIFAASNNAAEIRAVTYSGDGGGYVYSVKRPAGGWAITDVRQLRNAGAITRQNGNAFVFRNLAYAQQGREQAARAELMAQWTTIQEMARSLGSRVTRRRFQ